MRRILDHTASAVGGYVQGALTIALIAGIQAFIVMEILGVPFAAPLAVLAGLASLIPLVGATVAAIVIGLVTLFNDFPTDTIIWAVWAVIYQQIENNIIQPQVQRRTVQVQPIIVLIAVLFGSTLMGVAGRDRGDPAGRVDPDRAARVVGVAPGAEGRGAPGPDRAAARGRQRRQRLAPRT